MNTHETLLNVLETACQSESWESLLNIARKLDKLEDLKLVFQVEKNLTDYEEKYPDFKIEKAQKRLRQAHFQLSQEIKPQTFEDLSEKVAQHAQLRPNQVAIQDESGTWTWREFNLRTNQVANALAALEMSQDQRVGVLGQTSHEFLEIFIGTLRANHCIVPLSSLASSATLQLMAEDANLSIWFVSEKYRDLIAPFGKEIELKIALDFEAEGWLSYKDWRDSASNASVEMTYDPKDQFDIIYSSGTTGVPKGIIHSRGARHSRYAVGYALGFWPEAISLISTPLYSNTTMVSVLRNFAQGGKFILMKKFKVEELLQICEREKVTHAVLVPVQLQRILSHPDFDSYDLNNFELVLTTSAPLSVEIKRDMITRWPGKFIEIYGLTEGGPITALVANDHPDKLHTVGPPAGNSEIRVVDEEGREVPRGVIGELIGISDNMMDGYHNRADATKEAFGVQLEGRTWFRSGDYGAMDEDGFITLHGRKKETIISGGFNIYAVDLEEILKEHKSVREAAVFGIPSERWGETPMALIEVNPGHAVDVNEIKNWANTKLGKAQRIHAVEVIEELPRSPIGKVLKKVLRKPYWE